MIYEIYYNDNSLQLEGGMMARLNRLRGKEKKMKLNHQKDHHIHLLNLMQGFL